MDAKLQGSTYPPASRTGDMSRRTQDLSRLERCRSGDIAAFDEIVAEHQDRIYNLCYWMLGDRDDAADAAQEAFVRAFRSLARFRGDCAFGTWLHRIAVNVALDTAQSRKRSPVLYADLARADLEGNTLEPEDTEPADPQQEPQHVAMRHERSCAVRQALAQLPEHYRIVLVLFDLHCHSYEEVSVLLELPLGTVKSRLSRARVALRDKLESQRELFND